MSNQNRGGERPAWFYRVGALCLGLDDEIYPHYFDEDLSDIEEKPECECNDEDDCYCDDFDDDMSDRSYFGEDADWFYELKELREERKEEVQKEMKRKQEAIAEDIRVEDEVWAAYESMQKIEDSGELTVPLATLARKAFRLYSADHLEHYPSDLYGWPMCLSKYVEFRIPDDCYDYDPSSGERTMSEDANPRDVVGHVYLDASNCCTFVPFCTPDRASQQVWSVESVDGRHGLKFQFISDEYLRLTVTREMVFDGYGAPPPDAAPETYEFVGVIRDYKKEMEQRLEWQRKNRPRSPRESMFELNHPY